MKTNKHFIIILPNHNVSGAEKNLHAWFNILSDTAPCNLVILEDYLPFVRLKFVKILILSLRFNRSNIVFVSTLLNLSVYIVLAKLLVRSKADLIIREPSNPEMDFNFVSAVERRFYLLAKILFRYGNCIVSNSIKKVEFIKGYYRNENTVYIPNYVDKYNGIKSGKRAGNVFLVYGRILPIKGIEEIVNLWQQITSIHGLNWTLKIIGPTDNNLFLERLKKLSGMLDNVVIINENIHLSSIDYDIMLSNSLYEGMPNVLLESVTLGRSFIASNYKYGPLEILERFDVGSIVAFDNVTNFIETAKHELNRDKNILIANCMKMNEKYISDLSNNIRQLL